jgi:F-type H+-transporting ATPase subunit beta
MTYYIYENCRAKGHRAMIHRFDCHFCNKGQGIGGGTRPDNGKWLGPFTNLTSAETSAKTSGGRVEYCGKCMKDQ